MPSKKSEKERLLQQVSFRLHMSDHKVLKKLLEDDGMKFQTFVSSCIEAYIRGDPNIMKCIYDWKELNTIPKEMKSKYSLSQRERKDILDELETALDNEDEDTRLERKKDAEQKKYPLRTTRQI